jgi:hypothetical protein
MSTFYEIPLVATPQTLSVALGSITYNLTLNWNWIAQLWILDIADSANKSLVGGIPLVTGADLLEQYASLGFEGGLIVSTDSDPSAPPGFNGLGTTSHLYFVTTP